MPIVFKGVDNFVAPITYVGLYSDTTPMVKTDQWEDIVKNANTMILRADSLQEFTVGMFLADSIRASGGRISKLVIPYLPGARQDRVNPTGDVLLTAKSVAKMINDREFRYVVSVDPHSPIMPSHIEHFYEFPLKMIARKLWHGYTGVIAPDKGAKNRADEVARVLGRPVYYGEKVRDVATGRLSGFSIDVPEGGHYLVVDDICDGGGTFVGLGEKIKECGAYADLYVTHGIFSKGTNELKKFYKNIYTTDTRGPNEGSDTYIIKILQEMENF